MIYECKLCDISTTLKTDYTRHLSTKKHIINVKQQNAQICKKRINSHNITQKGIKNEDIGASSANVIVVGAICDYCNKKFKNSRSLSYHNKNSCKKIPVRIKNNYILSHNNNGNSKTKLELIDIKPTRIINNTMNNNLIVNNNLVINPVGNESIEHINKERMLEILSSGNNMLKEFCKELYSVTENLNVYLDFRCKMITFVNKDNKLEIDTMSRMIQKMVYTHMDRIKLTMKNYRLDLPDKAIRLFDDTIKIYNCVISSDNEDDTDYIEQEHDKLNIRLMEDIKTSLMLVKDKCKKVIEDLKYED